MIREATADAEVNELQELAISEISMYYFVRKKRSNNEQVLAQN